MQVWAPWEPDVVETLNLFQHSYFHPFTCGLKDQNHPGIAGELIAIEQCWLCPIGGCDFRQYWAHDFMCDREWLEEQIRWHEELLSDGERASRV